MSKLLSSFYDQYHQKNHRYASVISRHNFTYWYILKFLHHPLLGALQNKKVLDVGCGVGTLALYLSQYAKAVVGIDVSPRAISLARSAQQQCGIKNIIFREGELRDFSSDFDLVLCTEVIEHIADDRTFAQLLASNLRKDGYLLLTTPNSKNVLNEIGYYKKFDVEVGHLRRYTKASLTELLESVGLTVEKIDLVEGPLRSFLFTSKFGILIKGIRGPLIPLFHLFDAWLGSLFGYSDLVVLAKKTS